VDRPFDDAAGDAGVEGLPRQRGSGADANTPPTGPAELRTRTEYYEALRAADDGSAQADENRRQADTGSDHHADAGTDHHGDTGSDHPADTGTERSGWESVEAEDRPALDALRVTPEREKHILDGDSTGGGHRHGTGKPGKTEFPASWSDEKIIDTLVDVARRPGRAPGHQEWNDRWVARGTRDDVEMVAVITRDGCIWSGWPLPGGPGVVKNPAGS
jgi:Bacterial EndoU nuclease